MKVRIIHFDDEPNKVLTIPNSLCNQYMIRKPEWIDENELKYDDYVEQFILRPPGSPAVQVEYLLTPDIALCEDRLSINDADVKIAVFDLTRATDKGMSIDGKPLYEKALALGYRVENVFILTGFPAIYDRELKALAIPDTQRVVKPVAAPHFASLLAKLFPASVRPNGDWDV